MNKETLRDILFQKYFETEDGIPITELVENLSFIPEIWQKLHLLCEKNIDYFSAFSTPEKCKMIKHNEINYLIIKLKLFEYLIINIDKKENITQKDFENNFDELFFINNFDEVKLDKESMYQQLYHTELYNGNIEELINFCIENKDILYLSSNLYYRLEKENAWTYLSIDFVNKRAQLGFRTPDQFLYETLFLNYDLTPSRMQDATKKIGIDKMKEYFSKIKNINIPIKSIPNDLYQQYLIRCNTNTKKRNR